MHIKFNNQNKLHNLADFIPSNQLIRFIFLASPKLASLLFPTMAIMALTKSDYEHFSVVVSLAFAASTFSGDSLTLIISKYSIAVREYPKVFINFFVIIFLTTVVLLILGCYIFANNHFYNIKVLISIIALISINLLIPSTFNYIFYQNKVKKLFFILPFIVILSFTSACIVGMNFGYLELIMVYSSTFLIGTLYLIGEYLKATEKIKTFVNRIGSPQTCGCNR